MNHSFEGLSGKINRPRILFSQTLSVLLRSHSNHQRVPNEATAHMFRNHEAETYKHLLNLNILPIRKGRTQTPF